MQISRKPAADAVEPVTLPMLKQYLRVTHAHEDALLGRLLVSAREACENAARLSIIRKDIVLSAMPARVDTDDFFTSAILVDPDGVRDGLALPWGPILEVDSIVVTTRERTALTQTAGEHYAFDADFGSLEWIDKTRFNGHAYSKLRISYVAGYLPGEVPSPVVDAILETAAAAYTTRADLLSSLPMRALQLLAPFANRINMAG